MIPITRIGASEIALIDECRRAWVLGKVYEPKKPPIRYWIGTMLHAGLEAYYKYKRDPSRAATALEAEIRKSTGELAERFSGTWASYEREFVESVELLQGMLNNYTVYDSEEPLAGKILEVEKHYSVPLATTPWGTLTLSGRIDLVLKTPDGIVIVDHKSQSDARFPGGLDTDDQLTAYAFLYWKAHGVVPRILLYNVLVKAIPRAPKILKDGSLSKDVAQSTLYSAYLEELKDRGLDPGPYGAVLEKLKVDGWSKFFFRQGSTRNETELVNFENRMQVRAEEVVRMLSDPDKYAYPSGSNYRCSFCAFQGPCKSEEDGGDPQYILDNQFLRKENV